MRQITNTALRVSFIGWQCRIRQISARDYAGQPLPGMTPRVTARNGELLLPAMNAMLGPEEAAPSTAYFKFQVQKTIEPERARDSGVSYLAADFYQLPELFSDEMTAVFATGSASAASLLRRKEVLLDFDQYSQSYRMFAKVRRLPVREEAREFSLWLARIFNPNIPNEAEVLGFRPDWKSAVADPLPP